MATHISDGTPANVQSLHDIASNGDIITIPAGTFTWTTQVIITKGIILQGAGIGVTIVKDGVQGITGIQVTLAAGHLTRITGIEFQDGGRTSTRDAPGGILHVDGSNTDGSTFRFDHCKWDNLNGAGVFDTLIGVMDHNEIITTHTFINPYGSTWNGATLGDGSWTDPADFGGLQALYIEDNVFSPHTPGLQAVCDAYAGARLVIRYNVIHDGVIANHGTESTGRARGARMMEVYNNTFIGSDYNKQVGGIRSGGILFYNNTISGYWSGLTQFSLDCFRTFNLFAPWGGADATNAWDSNSPTTYFTGTATADSLDNSVLVSGPGFADNQWLHYVLRRTTDLAGTGTLYFANIVFNTANTLYYTGNGGYFGTTSMTLKAGDSVTILKINHALDQPGWGAGALITGDPPVVPLGWNNQASEPCYSWNNLDENAHLVNFEPGAGIQTGDYFNNTAMPGYTPYTYPHPLVSGTIDPPTPGGAVLIAGSPVY